MIFSFIYAILKITNANVCSKWYKFIFQINRHPGKVAVIIELSAIYHRPDSEYAYLYESDLMHIRLRTKKDDVKEVFLISGDPYSYDQEKWYLREKPLKKLFSTLYHDYWMIEVTAPFNRLAYGFHIIGNDGQEIFYGDKGFFHYEKDLLGRNTSYYFRMPYFHDIDRFIEPEWVKETVWYQIFPERFANGDPANDPEGTLPWNSKPHPGRDDFYGGDLQGVIDKLDYLQELGINGIYFCPIFKAKSNHKYDTIDYFEIDPDFGDKETFKRLVDEAHKRGIRIMLDAVFNHIGIESPQWQDVLQNQEKSRYADWFHIRKFPVEDVRNRSTEELEQAGTLNYETFAFTGHMPKLNTANREVQDYLIDIATYWIKEFDIDAWRLDVANEVDHQFWKRFYRETTRLKENFYIVGEIWHTSQSWLHGDEFHAVMNYAFTDIIADFFIKGEITAVELAGKINEHFMKHRQQTNEVMFNMLDSHDTPRLLTMCNGDKDVMKAALAFMFMHYGSPCIFYGTEIGLEGENDPDCRKCMVWDEEEQDRELFNFMQQLIKLRKEYADLISHGSLIWHDVREKTVGFTKQRNDHKLVCYFHKGYEDLAIALENKSKVLLSNRTDVNDDGVILKKNGFVIIEQ